MSDKMNTQAGSRIIDRKRGSNVLRETEINKATETIKPSKGSFSRRSFLGKSLAAGAVTMGAGLLANTLLAKEGNEKEKGHLKKGDAAILRFLAAAEFIEADLWQQYNELAGIQDSEVPGGTGSPAYTAAVQVLDSDMDQYIHDNTDDEITHAAFLNAFLVWKGADPVILAQFRPLRRGQPTGAQKLERLTNLIHLTVDTSWWT